MAEAAAPRWRDGSASRTGTSAIAPLLAGEAGARLDRLGRWDEAAAVLAEVARDARATASREASSVSNLASSRRGAATSPRPRHTWSARSARPRGGRYVRLAVHEAAAAVALARGRPRTYTGSSRSGDEAGGRLPGLRAARVRARARGGSGTRRARRARPQRAPACEEAVERTASGLLQTRALTARRRGGRWGESPMEACCSRRSVSWRRRAPAARPTSTAGRLRVAVRAKPPALPGRVRTPARGGSSARRRRAAYPSRRSASSGHALAAGLGARPLREEMEELARRARVDLSAGPATESARPRTGAVRAHGARARRPAPRCGGGEDEPGDRRGPLHEPKTASVHVSHILAQARRAHAGRGGGRRPPPRPDVAGGASERPPGRPNRSNWRRGRRP